MAKKKSDKVGASSTDEVLGPQKDEEVTEKSMTPSEYFNILNQKAREATEDDLKALFENAKRMMRKYQITGQKAGALKLYRFAELCEKELKVIRAGYSVYVNREDLDEYIAKIAKKTVVINKLEEFERDLPDDVVDKVAECKEQELFDEYVIVFTDYTGKERKKVEAARREKDPILLGVLKIGEQVSNRLYHIASWEDEYCDLTLDKMVKEFDSSVGGDTSMAKTLIEFAGSFDDFKAGFDAFKK